MNDYDRIEAAFLAAGIDPEFSAVIHEYHKNVYVYALVHTLANYMKELERVRYYMSMRIDYDRERTVLDVYEGMDQGLIDRMMKNG